MLRITIYERPQETSFLIEGRLVGRWVKALEKCWEIGVAAEPSRPIRVTLTVTSIDDEGQKLLTRMRRQGVSLRSTPVWTKAIIAQTEAEMETEEALWA